MHRWARFIAIDAAPGFARSRADSGVIKTGYDLVSEAALPMRAGGDSCIAEPGRPLPEVYSRYVIQEHSALGLRR